ncbi:4'-phosphopantetheinyl transferase superfamily protein [Streptomyces sp. NBC_01142]|uniref:4'-phosphopantetheinyl transferase family protein n=1 Tax=Streptomyces sp. NBC_01142 TaxID=2975865 RepID=UPI0022552407|nr:4'-phosphopantetheinyl transferase superfamily protein [Streptomyces sp. NBC_01142]MCX4819029.1 4'-phosphopantetheinyl transferase superfamily protein [Streptomyces sp. NBC_01142]
MTPDRALRPGNQPLGRSRSGVRGGAPLTGRGGEGEHPAVPALEPGQCQLWWASAADAHPALHQLLDTREATRHAALRNPASRALHLTAHALARAVAAPQLGLEPHELELTVVCKHCGGPHGKPQPPDPLRLSLSHSGGRVVVALAHSTPVGVDVEEISPYVNDVAERVLAPQERVVLAALPEAERPAGFIRYWTRKEALLKSTGDGLAVAPDLLRVTAPDAPPRLLAWDGPDRPLLPLRLYDLDAGPGHRAALAALGAPLRLAQHDGSALLRLHTTERELAR